MSQAWFNSDQVSRYIKLGEFQNEGKIWWPNLELNQGHADFQSAALPTELFGHALIQLSEQNCSEVAYLSRSPAVSQVIPAGIALVLQISLQNTRYRRS